MPVLSCGGMRFQHRWDEEPSRPIPQENQDNLQATITAALSHGIRHIETARGYGTSEAQLGPILQKIPREDFILQTKVSPQEDPQQFENIFHTSLAKLGLPWVDLFSLHGINNRELLDISLRKDGCLDRARTLQKKGLCRWVGFSTHGAPDLVEELVASGRFDYVNLHWYYIFQEHSPSLAAAQKNDMGLFIISPNDKGGMLYQPPAKLSALTQPLSPMAFNTLFCLSRPEIHTLSIGAARPSDFEEHIQTLTYLSKVKTLLPPILTRLQTQWNQALPERWRATWDVGLPHWATAPREANFREILRLYNLAVAYDLTDYARMRYNLLGQGGHWFAGQSMDKLTQEEVLPSLRDCPDPKTTLEKLFAARDLLSGEKRSRLGKD